ncbi:hypothetical protein CDG60_08005 [Acinetobacter chinensis]|uniref:Uncharacterized protein n=1 Tax=Acinetobacter chinensis TaxID=2004650 RepID=A0A3B7LUI1_9GAMM|nr:MULTISPECIES: hypothetical protein [Acinetobacter]AXY56512.1 hypothetical protein CDG60_08005 [Acinetobacter chinensis]AXY59900.1 hypothetical protein CDG61_07620 [Acinetobacter sp. WCHAc010052]MDV2468194.1 hypothetical protein [Acinetobacter chinensis]WOE42953.1 hypothetical protein QSG87_07520 [Acinetobacter chinensis]
MRTIKILSLITVILSLNACSKIPEECADSWSKMEKLSRQMGLTDEQIKSQKSKFEHEIKQMDKAQATEMCKSQSTLLGVVGQ